MEEIVQHKKNPQNIVIDNGCQMPKEEKKLVNSR